MDDIWFEVLLRLPPKSLSRIRVVSRRWFQLISTSLFRQNYAKRWRGELKLLGFFFFDGLRWNKPDKFFKDEPIKQLSSYWSPSTSTTEVIDFLKGREIGFFISTCNGLVLSCRLAKYYVCNPVSKKFYQLPPRQIYSSWDSVAFWCEDSDDNCSINYKIVCSKLNQSINNQVYSVPIETFCSRTKKWSQAILKCSSPFRLWWRTVAAIVTRSGVIYWKATEGRLAIHDLNQQEQEDGTIYLTLIQHPRSSREILHESFGESTDGRLQYGESDRLGIQILVLDKLQDSDYTWILRYKLSFSLMLIKNPTIYESHKFYFVSFIPQNSESIFIRGGWDKFFIYHLGTGIVEQVPYQRGHSPESHFPGLYNPVVPYYEQLWPDLYF